MKQGVYTMETETNTELDLKSIQFDLDVPNDVKDQMIELSQNNSVTLLKNSISDIRFTISYEENKWHTLVEYKLTPIYPSTKSKFKFRDQDDARDKKISEQLTQLGIDKESIKKLLFEARQEAGKQDIDIEHLRTVAIERINTSCTTEGEEKKEIQTPEEMYGPVVFKRATDLIEWGQAQEFIVKKHHESCAGASDKYSYALSCVFGSTHTSSSVGGTHLKFTGPSGLGKSTMVDNYFDLTIPNTRVLTSMSGKNMFYDTELKPNMVIGIDEFENADSELIKTIKLSTSKFQDKTTHKTVIDFESKTKTIPERVAFILLSVLPLDNAEMLSRFITLDVPESETYKLAINAKQKNREQRLITKDRMTDFDTLVCRCIYSILNQKVYDIRVPFAPVIEWHNIEHTRNWEMFVDIIRCVAFYNILNREYFHKLNEPETGVYLATYEDYITAAEVYSRIAESNETKLSTNELKIMQALIEARNKNMEEQLSKNIDRKELTKKLETHNLSDVDIDDLSCFGIMDIVGLSKMVGIPDKRTEYLINGDKSKGIDGLTSRIIGLHAEKCTCKCSYKNGDRTRQKYLIWYDGPDNLTARGISIVSRDVCETETAKCKERWIQNWISEDMKWAENSA